MSITDVDRLYMRAAVALAERGLYTVTRNNPRVGCLLVKNGKVIGRGWHAKDGEAHAEVAALRSLQDGVSPKGSTAYVTLEPCCWEGRTAACTEQLINAKLNRVVVGREDPHPKVQGRGIQVLKEAGIPTEVLSLPELESLNPGQVSRVQSNRPWIRIKSAISMDGRTGMASGESQWITGPEARRDVQVWRARSGAILTGIGTVLADDPQLTVRDERFTESRPIRVICDSNARLPLDAKILEDVASLHIATKKGIQPTIEASHISWSHCGGSDVDLLALMSELAIKGVNELLVEAGPKLTGRLFQQELWDEWLVYIAPKLLGSTASPVGELALERLAQCRNGRVVSVDQIGEDLRVLIRKSDGHT